MSESHATTEHTHHAGHAAQEHGDHGHQHPDHAGHGDHVGQFRRLFWINLLLAAPVVAFSSMFAMLIGYRVPEFLGSALIAPVLGTVMYLWGGRPFLTGGWAELRARKPGMMLLIALAITVAFVASWAPARPAAPRTRVRGFLALLIGIMLLGHWVEMRSLAQTTSALDSLAALLPDQAERVDGDTIVTVDPGGSRVGDVVIVRPGGGASPPTAGSSTAAPTWTNRWSPANPGTAARGVGDHVTAGTVATDSGLRVEVTAIGDDTTLAGIRARSPRPRTRLAGAARIADKAAAWLFWFALGAAVVTAIAWTCWSATPIPRWCAPSPCW